MSIPFISASQRYEINNITPRSRDICMTRGRVAGTYWTHSARLCMHAWGLRTVTTGRFFGRNKRNSVLTARCSEGRLVLYEMRGI